VAKTAGSQPQKLIQNHKPELEELKLSNKNRLYVSGIPVFNFENPIFSY